MADGHKTESPRAMTYSTVVGRDSVRIMLLVAALNELSVKAEDIKNDFLAAPNRENHYIIVVPEFGIYQGKCFIVVKALYGLKSAGASFRVYLASKLYEIDFKIRQSRCLDETGSQERWRRIL